MPHSGTERTRQVKVFPLRIEVAFRAADGKADVKSENRLTGCPPSTDRQSCAAGKSAE